MSINKPGILYIVCGTPGSGKSTFLREMTDEYDVIISRDEIRFSILRPGEEYFSHEKEVYRRFLNDIAKYLKLGYDVYADATHLTQKSRSALFYQLKQRNCLPSEVNAIYFKVPLKVCIERNEQRKGTKTYVPADQVEQMFVNYVPPSHYEGFTHIWEVNEESDVTEIQE